eukprot:TRINITY_DN2660_c0_g1_i1.p1 TRINITY_DN2660_c0_g1~~TRINITY_DN2660_c0_g1_i1.p1  ORF type:complete len:355 (-),score=169.50 TRINITY_DN2660_c0_g1_i1:171-1235(-)
MVDVDKIKKKIVRQVDYYFGDFNLSRDKFLKEKIKECDGGWIPLEVMLKFQRLSTLASGDGPLILKALKEAAGELMEVDEEGSRIRRKPELPVPELTEELKNQRQDASVYVKGFDKENTDTDEIIEFFDSISKNVICVDRRTWVNKKENTKGFKGSVFVLFTSKEDAEAFMNSKDELKYKEVPLEKKWQKDYFSEKRAEMDEKKKKKNEKKTAAVAPTDQHEPLPKGSILVMEGLVEGTSREDIKEELKANYEVDLEDIAYIYYERGQETAQLRFKKENAANDVFTKISEKEGGEFKVKDAKIEYKVLKEEEEEKFLAKCVEDIRNQRKRKSFGGRGGGRGGRGGRGGKRPRHK